MKKPPPVTRPSNPSDLVKPTPPLYPLVSPAMMTRRSFVAGTASFVAAALWSNHARGAVTRQPLFVSYPFTLGVASGDPAPDSVVLWTRLAPVPLAADGGMGSDPVEVSWQVAEDEGMRRVVRSGTAVANAAWAHSVHVEVEGLRPDRWYWYRFKAGTEQSPLGRTRTLPAAGALPDRLRFAFVSCQKYEDGYYTAFQHLAREELDLIVHLGDYIYEREMNAGVARPIKVPEIFSLADYRHRYALYKLDPALQAAHAAVPWIVTWDDHEVSNNYANDIPQITEGVTREAFLARRAAGYQAYFEHLPLRRRHQPKGPDMPLYRRIDVGRLAAFNVLDTRQYRTDQPLGDGNRPWDPVLLDPAGTLLGAEQRDWLYNGLERSATTWNVLAQQIMMQPVGRGDPPAYSMDKWGGYEFERRAILRRLRESRIKNPVVLAGDIHSNWANQLSDDFDQPDGAPIAPEFVGTSISSGGDGFDQPQEGGGFSQYPAVKYFNNERGYVRCEVTPRQWRTDYRTVAYVTRPGAPIQTRRSFMVESGRPHLQAV